MPTPAVLIRLSTGQIIKHDNLPGDPLAEIPGLDPDLKWLIKFQPFAQPVFDSRLFILKRVEEITEAAHPDYPLYHQFLITFDTVKRPAAEIKAQVDNAERLALARVFPAEKQLKTLALGLAVLFRKSADLALNPEEQALEADVLGMCDLLWQNSDNAAQLKAAVDLDQEPNLDAGWQNPAP